MASMRARFRKGFDKEVPLTPGSVEQYDIDLWFTSRVFEPGHKIRVTVSSALFPKYDRNLNTGGNNERDSTFVVAHQRLLHDAAHPSPRRLARDPAMTRAGAANPGCNKCRFWAASFDVRVRGTLPRLNDHTRRRPDHALYDDRQRR